MGKNHFKGTKIFFYHKWAALLSYEEKQKRKKCVIFWANKSFYISSFSPFIFVFLVFLVTLLVAFSEFRGKFWCRTFLWKNGKRIEFTLVTLISLPFGWVFSWILVGKMCWKRRLWFLQNWAQYKRILVIFMKLLKWNLKKLLRWFLFSTNPLFLFALLFVLSLQFLLVMIPFYKKKIFNLKFFKVLKYFNTWSSSAIIF